MSTFPKVKWLVTRGGLWSRGCDTNYSCSNGLPGTACALLGGATVGGSDGIRLANAATKVTSGEIWSWYPFLLLFRRHQTEVSGPRRRQHRVTVFQAVWTKRIGARTGSSQFQLNKAFISAGLRWSDGYSNANQGMKRHSSMSPGLQKKFERKTLK